MKKYTSYEDDMKKMESGKSQSIKEDKGNNAGPGTTQETTEGKIDIKGTGDYMGGTPDAAGKK